MIRTLLFLSSFILLSINSVIGQRWPTLTGEPTQINAHRGETVFVPENTLQSTALAALEMAEHIELDLALTKDGVLVVYHDLTLRGGSNVADLPQFEHKLKNFTGVVEENGPVQTIRNNWFVNDFTIEELKQLGVKQRNVGIRPKLFDGLLGIPTFTEFLDTAHHSAHALNKSVGLVVELKSPYFYNTYYEGSNNSRYFENSVISTLQAYGYPITVEDSPSCKSAQDNNAQIQCGHLVIQSFDLRSMQYTHQIATAVEMSMLINTQLPLLTYQGAQELSTWIKYFSPWKELLYTGILAQIEKEGIEYDEQLIDDMGGFIPPQEIVPFFHSVGVKVFIYTIYDSREASRRGCTVVCDPENKEAELFYYFDMGVDGMFSENLPETREIRMKYQYEKIGF